jgi:diguanylate cyclase (GGDEF)-like protein
MEGEAFTIALLAEIGRLAMLKTAPQDYAEVAERARREGMPIEQCEREAFGTDHRQLSLDLMRHWNLPERFSNAIAHRSSTAEALQALPPGDERSMAHSTAFSSMVASYYCVSPRGLTLAMMSDLGHVLFGMSQEEIDAFIANVGQTVKATADLFETDPAQMGSPTELMTEAMEQLCTIASTVAEGQAAESIRNRLLDENGKLKQRIQDLVQRGSRDWLTGVYNRGYFDDQLTTAIARATASREPLGLLFLDADHFKRINDEYGHLAGDAVLQRLANVISHAVRRRDVVARYGGEEFVVLLAEPSVEALESLAERVRGAVEAERIPVEGGGVIRVTISIGGAVFEPPHSSETSTNLLMSADAALYEAKTAGRNCFVIKNVVSSPTPAAAADN